MNRLYIQEKSKVLDKSDNLYVDICAKATVSLTVPELY